MKFDSHITGRFLPKLTKDSKFWRAANWLGTFGHNGDNSAAVTILNQSIGAAINIIGTATAIVRSRQIKVSKDAWKRDNPNLEAWKPPPKSMVYHCLVGAQGFLSFITDNVTSTAPWIHGVTLTSMDAAHAGGSEGELPKLDLTNHPFERALHSAGTLGGRRQDAAAIAMCEDYNTIVAALMGAYADQLAAKGAMTSLDAAKWCLTVGFRVVLRTIIRNKLADSNTVELVTRGALRNVKQSGLASV